MTRITSGKNTGLFYSPVRLDIKGSVALSNSVNGLLFGCIKYIFTYRITEGFVRFITVKWVYYVCLNP